MRSATLYALVSLQVAAAAFAGEARPAADAVQWSRDIAPILAAKCFTCHGPDPESRKAGLRLDRREDAIRAEEGLDPAVAPGLPERSELLRRVLSTDADERMPPVDGHEAVTAREAELLRRWIADGAVYERHWSWRALAEVEEPQAGAWSWTVVDRFVERSLAAEGLAPAGDVDGPAWLRRASHAIRGLPPRDAWLQRVLDGDSPLVRAALVDEMLAEPAFGEHWGRHWLDLMRYAESRGHEFDYSIREAWRYRDWVVSAFNSGLPWDRFVLEQVAGDLLQPRIDPADGTDAALAATGWWWLSQGTHAPVDVRLDEAERIDNQLDVLGKAFLGTTVACARCHDHKFDDFAQRDYTALFGVARSTRLVYAWQDPHGAAARTLREAEAVRARLEQLFPRQEVVQPIGQVPPGALWRFDGQDWNGWTASGGAFGSAPLGAGALCAPDGAAPRRNALACADSGALHAKARGALRSPTFVVEQPELWLRVRGKDATVRVHVDGYFLDEENALLFESHRQQLDHPDEWRTLRIDLARYVGEEAWIEVLDQGGGSAAIAWVAAGTLDDAWKEARKDETQALDAPEGLRAAVEHELAALRQAGAAFPEQSQVLAAADGSGRDAPLYARGQPRQAKERVPRGGPRVLGELSRAYAAEALAQAAPSGTIVAGVPASASGRAELAASLVDPAHPLVWRVAANRVWHHALGAGLVASTDDFGVLGRAPGHPELLDWLACRLREHRSIKRLLREIVLSRVFAQRSRPAEGTAADADPDGARLSRRGARRLEAEAVRDTLLSISGRLVETQGGPPVPVHLTDYMQGRGRPGSSGPQDGDGRRSIYLEMRRNFADPMLAAFDQPVPNAPRGSRSVSNVPSQSLVLMNAPLVRDLAASFARRIQAVDGDCAARVRFAIRAAWARPAHEAEVAAALGFLGTAPDLEAWTDYAHALFLSKETIYLP